MICWQVESARGAMASIWTSGRCGLRRNCGEGIGVDGRWKREASARNHAVSGTGGFGRGADGMPTMSVRHNGLKNAEIGLGLESRRDRNSGRPFGEPFVAGDRRQVIGGRKGDVQDNKPMRFLQARGGATAGLASGGNQVGSRGPRWMSSGR